MRFHPLTTVLFGAATLVVLAACNGGEENHQIIADCAKPSDEGERITVTDAWVRETNASSRVSAAFFTICNQTSTPQTLVSVRSPAAGRLELHQSSRSADGVASMRPVERISVPANGAVDLAPGGFHIMLFDLNGAISTGAPIELELTFANGETVLVAANARAINATSGLKDSEIGSSHDGRH